MRVGAGRTRPPAAGRVHAGARRPSGRVALRRARPLYHGGHRRLCLRGFRRLDQAAGAGAAQGAANIAGGAAGMTGPNAYKAFMSPYQQQVIDTSLAEF